MGANEGIEERLVLLEKKFSNIVKMIVDSEVIKAAGCSGCEDPEPISEWEMEMRLEEDQN